MRLITKGTIRQRPRRSILNLRNLIRLSFNNTTNIRLRLNSLLALIQTKLNIRTGMTLTTKEASLSSRTVHFLKLTRIRMVAMALLSIQVKRRLTIISLVQDHIL